MEQTKQSKVLSFLMRLVKGIPVGVAFIIPGFSGGSVAAILGIYDELLESITGILKHFRQSLAFLIPLLLGMVLGAGALLFPLQWGLNHCPMIVVSLFVGLALGGIPSLTPKTKGKWSAGHVFALVLPLLFTAAIGFLPAGGDVNLLELDGMGYVLLFLVGVVGAAALIVPGISGSMLLLILGYYNPILTMFTEYLLKGQMIGHALLVLCVAGLGIVVGFFLISFVMKLLLRKFPKGTHIAIIGFIIGSAPTVYLATAKDVGMGLVELAALPFWHWILAAVMLIGGFIAAFAFVRYAQKRESETPVSEKEV